MTPKRASAPSTLDVDYLASPQEAADFLTSIAETRVLAVDTEGASFHRFVDRIYLLQLSTETRHAIIDPLQVPSPNALGRLLEAPQVEVVFHDADYDLRLLHQDYGWRVVNIFDTRIAAQLAGIKSFGLAALLERYFGIKLDKRHQRADWSMRPLTADMLDYAAQDTRHLLALRERLRHELTRLGRWGWAQEEFARLEGTQWPNDDADMAYLRTKGARDLSRRGLAILRELSRWRDDVARAIDKSSFRVAGNEVLLDLARQAPTTTAALKSTKGLGARLVELRGEEILEAIRRGLAVPEEELPRWPKAPRWNRDPSFDDRLGRLKTVRDAAAERLSLDPGVLCGRERMETIARRNPTSLEELSEVPEVRRWQVEALGDAFLRALRNGNGDSPQASTRRSAGDSPYRDG